jgi:hypothetical protein
MGLGMAAIAILVGIVVVLGAIAGVTVARVRRTRRQAEAIELNESLQSDAPGLDSYLVHYEKADGDRNAMAAATNIRSRTSQPA